MAIATQTGCSTFIGMVGRQTAMRKKPTIYKKSEILSPMISLSMIVSYVDVVLLIETCYSTLSFCVGPFRVFKFKSISG